MEAGHSWSGNERNVCYLNTGDGSFVDASGVSGLDFPDDARCAVVVDWDADGDLDLWIRNRTGPKLRFLENDAPRDDRYVALELVGTDCNRDAIGAVVEVYTPKARSLRQVTCGEGYLAQSSRRLHFGLGAERTIERVVVHWPDGSREELSGPAVGRSYVLRQHAGAFEAREERARIAPVGGGALAAEPPESARTLLRVPLAVPPTLARLVDEDAQATLITLWAHWCAPCIAELRELGGARADLAESGIEVLALNVDETEDRAEARALFQRELMPRTSDGGPAFTVAEEPVLAALQSVFEHVYESAEDIALPAGLLVDGAGRIQLLYAGAVTPAQLEDDVTTFVHSEVRGAFRGLYGGRWYFNRPRDLRSLAASLRGRGLDDDARFYEELVEASRPRTR